jgi:hypothetical protein
LKRVVEEQQTVIAAQKKQLEDLSEQVESLRKRVDETAAIAAATSSQIGDLQKQTQASLGSQLQALEQTVKQLPELPERAVTAGEFPGSINVPGTNTALKLGGQIWFTLVHTFEPLGTDDRFIASSIPGGQPPPGEAARTNYTAAPSRVNLDLRGPTPLGAVRTFVEADFGGDGNTARLRHAFLQTSHWLFGQTWSTFADPEVRPIDIDFEGENALSRFRQTQVRYTRALGERLEVAVAIENPAPDLTGAAGVNLTPDFVARLRWEPEKPADVSSGEPAHIQGAILFKTLRGELAGQPQTSLSTEGFGGTVGGVIVPRWDTDDRVKFAAYGGWGVGRYITDLDAAGGQDGVYDPTTNTLRTLPVASGYIAYEHRWHPLFRSSLTYGVVTVHNLDIQTTEALHRTQRTTANLAWTPMTRAEFIVEFLSGDRVNKNGAHASSTQFQAGWKFRF